MNFLEIINKCLVELNYRTVETWEALTLNDHKRLIDVLKRLNSHICVCEEWDFLQRSCKIRILSGQNTIHNPVSGRISVLLIDGIEYFYSPDYKQFIVEAPPARRYTTFGPHILFPSFPSAVECEILYHSQNSAVDIDNNEKLYLELGSDFSLLPQVFQEPVLVYGACMRIKSNTDHNKFKFWYTMFNDAMATLRAKSHPTCGIYPQIVPKRF